MSRVPDFLATYNRIDAYLRKILGASDETSFSSLIKEAKRINRIIAKYEDDLRLIGKLRNVLVHEQKKPNFIVAEPHQEIIKIAKDIENTLVNPPLVIPTFQRNVITFTNTEFISKPLKFVKENDFSQFPVYDEKNCYIGLLTERCIARWLAHQVRVGEEMMLIEETTIGSVLSFQETDDNASFLSRTATIYEAQESFIKNRSLDAILITENKNPNASLLGIITLWDIIALTNKSTP